MEIIVKYKSFVTRYLKSMSITLGLILFFILILKFPVWLLYILIPVLISDSFLSLLKEKYHVSYLKCDKENIYIEYYRFNTKLKEAFKVKEFDLLYSGEFGYAPTGKALIFRKNKKKFLVQYRRGEWTNDKLVEFYEFIRKTKLGK